FRFLDGDGNYLQRGLKEAANHKQSLQIHLVTGCGTLDWPFELLAQGDSFLLPTRVHLVRRVSDWGSAIQKKPQNQRLRVLFMACSPIDVEPELDYEREEEAIFKITENLPIDLVVEDSGSLEGLKEKLVQRRFDVVHLSGHADIHADGRPFFLMEDETGYRRDVSPGELWQEALIDNPPRLLFLSGCRTGEAPEGTEGSFARQLVKEFNVPSVLGWGRSVNDVQAIEAEEMVYRELSRGESIVHAVQRARNRLFTGFETGDSMDSDWPLLRLFCSGVPLSAMVEKEQKWQPKIRNMKHVYLKNSKVRVLEEGFVGRRRQLQQSVRALKWDKKKVGVLMSGTAGLGKSCLAGKASERFKRHTLIIVNGKLNAASLGRALKDAFILAWDDRGKSKLAGGTNIKEMLGDLCASCFKERNYLILLDDFDQNLEGAEKGQPDRLLPEAAELLHELLYYLPFSGNMTNLIITCRCGFTLTSRGRDLVAERLERVWLTGLRESSLLKKAKELEYIWYLPGWGVFDRLLTVSCGNPRLMERLDGLGKQINQMENQEWLKDAFTAKQEEFIGQHFIRELLQWGGDELAGFLRPFAIFRKPVPESCAREVAEKVG
ncbi:MAG: CHAT domain-containing protein, partial [bacterium]|nr:CHAT domain-containing protein [bacterium]